MITKEIAVNATYRQLFYHTRAKNADGTPLRVRVNGKCKTWKTRPEEFRLPVKYGLRECFYIDQDNAHEFTTKEHCVCQISVRYQCPHCGKSKSIYEADISAPGYGTSYQCLACSRSFVVVGNSVVDHALEMTIADVI